MSVLVAEVTLVASFEFGAVVKGRSLYIPTPYLYEYFPEYIKQCVFGFPNGDCCTESNLWYRRILPLHS